MSDLKTAPTPDSVSDFIESIADPRRQREARQLVALLSDASGEPPVMWGKDIVGFGSYHYRYASGREGDWMVTGFSPRKTKLSIYLMDGVERHADELAKMGPYTNGVSCLYLKSLDGVDEEVLSDVVRASVAYVRETLDQPEVAAS
ncbi:MAG: hypothetical protein Rubg2KO_22930 [Rubricoccaceae bacterium]